MAARRLPETLLRGRSRPHVRAGARLVPSLVEGHSSPPSSGVEEFPETRPAPDGVHTENAPILLHLCLVWRRGHDRKADTTLSLPTLPFRPLLGMAPNLQFNFAFAPRSAYPSNVETSSALRLRKPSRARAGERKLVGHDTPAALYMVFVQTPRYGRASRPGPRSRPIKTQERQSQPLYSDNAVAGRAARDCRPPTGEGRSVIGSRRARLPRSAGCLRCP